MFAFYNNTPCPDSRMFLMGGRHMAKINVKTEDRKLGGDVNQRDSQDAEIHLFLRGVSHLWRAKSQVGRQ